MQQFDRSWSVLVDYVVFWGIAVLRQKPNPFLRFQIQLESRLTTVASTTDDADLKFAIEEILTIVAEDDANPAWEEDTWSPITQPKIDIVTRAFEKVRAAAPTMSFEPTRAEGLFPQMARDELEKLPRATDSAREQMRERPEESVAPSATASSHQTAPTLNEKEAERARQQGFKCIQEFCLTGKPGRTSQPLEIQVGETSVDVGIGQHPFLLRLSRAHFENDDGWVSVENLGQETWLADGQQQAIARLREPIKNVSLGDGDQDARKNHLRLIEQDRSCVRLSVPRSQQHVDREALAGVLDEEGGKELSALFDAMPI